MYQNAAAHRSPLMQTLLSWKCMSRMHLNVTIRVQTAVCRHICVLRQTYCVFISVCLQAGQITLKSAERRMFIVMPRRHEPLFGAPSSLPLVRH
jgi:hypothetical protein